MVPGSPGSQTPATGYRVERLVGSGPTVDVTQNLGVVLTYTDPSLTLDTHYYYRVYVVNSGGTSVAAPTHCWTVPAAATALSCTATSNGNEIQITFTDGNATTTGYRIERRIGSQVAALDGSVQSVSGPSPVLNSGLGLDTHYYFKLLVVNVGGQSGEAETDCWTWSHPQIAWGAAPTLSVVCGLTVLGTTTYDPNYTASANTAAGSLGSLCSSGNLSVTDTGLTCTTIVKTRGTVTSTWDVTDSRSLSSSLLSRSLTLRFVAGTAFYVTDVAVPASPLVLGDDAMVGRQVWFGTQSAPGGACGNCESPRGSLALRAAGGCVLDGTGGVECWGAGASGQNGHDSVGNALNPVAVCTATSCTSTLGAVTAVAAGGTHTCALMADSTVNCWGDNTNGELGNLPALASSQLAVSVCNVLDCSTNLTGVKAIAAGPSHNCVIFMGADTLLCWGLSTNGRVGSGDSVTYKQPTSVCKTGSVSGGDCTSFNSAVAVTAGGAHSCALIADGTVWCWGSDSSGQLGNGSTTADQLNPVQVCTALNCSTKLTSGVAALAAGDSHTCALMTAGTVKCWGDDAVGQLGNNSSPTPSEIPVDVCADATCAGPLTDVRAIASGGTHTCALVGAAGDVYCWGDNGASQLSPGGSSPPASSSVPVKVCSSAAGVACTSTLTGATAIAASGNVSCALNRQNGVWCWGDTSSNAIALGAGGAVTAGKPVSVCASGAGDPCSGAALKGAAMAVCGTLEVAP